MIIAQLADASDSTMRCQYDPSENKGIHLISRYFFCKMFQTTINRPATIGVPSERR